MAEVQKKIIGRTELIDVLNIQNVPAKTDTGADYSSIWATSITEVNGELRCILFDQNSQYYTGHSLTFTQGMYEQTRVASSSGHRQARYAVKLPIRVAGRKLQARFSLAERHSMLYPVLLGCNILNDRFLVDVSKDIPIELREQLKRAK